MQFLKDCFQLQYSALSHHLKNHNNDDENILIAIALNDSKWRVCIIALSKLNISVLHGMDCKESYLNVRINDIKNDCGQILRDIALNDYC